jgi:hypothetical protein
LARFDRVQNCIARATTKSELETLVAQSAAVVQLRAYLAPQAELEIQGRTTLSTMAEWGVPASDLDALQKDVVPKLGCPTIASPEEVNAARGALHTIFSECNSWSEWLDEYNAEMQKVAYWLTGLIALSLIAAIFLLSHGFIVWGLLSAGACGAFVSVIAKLPALVIAGDSAPYRRDIWRRVCTGLAASVIGSGLLMSGVFTINLPYASMSAIIDGCTSLASATTASQSVGCGPRSIFVLIAVVMLFGLSERALTSLEQRVFPAR